MGFFFSFLAIFGESAGKTVDKINFRKNHITYRQSLLLTFFFMSLFLLGYVAILRLPIPHFSATALLLLSAIVLFSFAGNVFDEISLKTNDLSLREPLVDFQPILAGLVGYALFPNERKPIFLLAFTLGALVVYWGSHRRKLRKHQSKGLVFLLLAAIFYAFLPSIYQETLKYVSPAYISLIRCVSILVLLAIFLPVRKVTKISTKKVKLTFYSAFFYAGEAIAGLYAIQRLGVVLTMVILMLGPAMRYWSSMVILKEKVRTGEMFSSFALTVLVVVTLLK